MNMRERAIRHYLDNPLAHCFVDVLCKELGQKPNDTMVAAALGHAPLLDLLDAAQLRLEAEKLRLIMGSTPLFRYPESP